MAKTVKHGGTVLLSRKLQIQWARSVSDTSSEMSVSYEKPSLACIL